MYNMFLRRNYINARTGVITIADNTIGIGLYYTKTPGLGGLIRQQIEDFVVEELTNRVETTNGKYLIVELTKKNWDILCTTFPASSE